jgi:hypothetical protein
MAKGTASWKILRNLHLHQVKKNATVLVYPTKKDYSLIYAQSGGNFYIIQEILNNHACA